MVSCSHAWYLYDGRWAPVECDLCWGRVILIQSFLYECQINFMNHKTCPDCRLMILHYTLVLCQLLSEDQILALFNSSPPSGSIFVFVWHVHFDNSISIWLLPSAVSCRQSVNTIIPLPRTQHYPSYSLRRLFMMSIQKNMLNSPVYFSWIHTDFTHVLGFGDEIPIIPWKLPSHDQILSLRSRIFVVVNHKKVFFVTDDYGRMYEKLSEDIWSTL